jgi:methionyl-tRNA formyltransferase
MARVVFLGTPHFGVPTLQALIAHHQVVAVVTQPDRPAGRGRSEVRVSPVKAAALAAGVTLIVQPRRLSRDVDALQMLRELDADVFCLAAYGQILRREVLKIPPHGTVGVHASLLPKYRGAAPIAAAILHGERETGITLMLTDEGMDTGPILAQRAVPIAADDTTASLSVKLAHLGAELLIETLPVWLAGQIQPIPQNDAEATYAPPLDKSQGVIDWRQSAAQIDRQIRAFTPWPGSYCACKGRRLKILKAYPLPDWRGKGEPGDVVAIDGAIAVVTGQGALVLEEVQLAGRKAMSVQQFARGRQDFTDATLE